MKGTEERKVRSREKPLKCMRRWSRDRCFLLIAKRTAKLR